MAEAFPELISNVKSAANIKAFVAALGDVDPLALALTSLQTDSVSLQSCC
jgi:hypothetical protein